MAKKFLRLFFVATMLLGLQSAMAAFKDFKVDLYPLVTEAQGTQVEFGVAFADDGSAQRVAASDASAALIVNGKAHNDHGMLSFTAKVNVDGPVKISIGSCQYGTGDVTITNSDNEVVGTLNSNLGNCFAAGKEETIASTNYMGGATTLTIASKNYTRYIAVEKIETTKTITANIISLLTAEENANGNTPVNFGVKMVDGAATRVAADDASADLVISGKTNNEHGILNFVATAPVKGPVKVGIGSCQYGNGEVIIKNANGEQVGSFDCNLGNCFNASKPETIAYGYYKGTDPTTLTITCKNYTPYISIEPVDPATLIEEASVIFSLGDVTAEGDVPEAIKDEVGKKVTIPVNHTLYAAGKTLKGWTDGTTTYAIGSEVEIPATDLTLTPVFADNTNSLADRKEAVTVLFDFQRKNGAPILSYEGRPGVYVTQVTVNGETIDVPTHFTTSPGKLANANWNDWAQINNGTTFTVPSCKGAEVSIEAFGDVENKIQIDGQTDYPSGSMVNYTIVNTADQIDIVFGDKGSYFRYIKVVLPYVAQSVGGKVYSNEPAEIVWDYNSADYATANSIVPADAFSVITIDNGDLEFTGTGTGNSAPGVTFVKLKPSGTTKAASWIVKPAKGITFTPTAISMYIQRFGTDAESGVVVTATTTEGKTVTLGTYTAPRNNKNQADDKYGSASNYQPHVEIELTPAQQAELATAEGFTLSATIGVGNSKEGGFSDVHIAGTVNGTVANVAKYSVTAVASPEGSAEITVYPKADVYEEGSEVKLTAAKNFGYKFINWTDAEGKIISVEPVFILTVDKAYELTANLAPVNTFELNYSVDGGANLYMVTPAPAPTVVDGKNMYEEGTNVSLTATSNPIVTFTNWSDGQTSGEIIVQMTQDVEIVANYSAVDFIAGWDFILSGGSGRPADFAAPENDAVSLILRNDDNDVQGWLDKSQQAAGGYEGRPGAVNWRTGTVNGDVGNYYFQTMVNASAFTDLKVQTSSVYNYNSYKKYDVQYSLDGENWKTIGSLKMEGTKNWTDLTASVPADANNQAEVYFRWYPDRNSDVDGTASKNDGFCLGATYITGTAKLVNDGVAPKLVSTVPAEGADNASANGKIVLTFDEKVKVADGTVATLGDQQLKPTVSGKVVTFEYKGLSYTTDYTFKLKGGAVMDLCDNTLMDDITIHFATKTKPEVTKALYDFIVPDDGNFREAVEAANARADKSTRFYIFVKQGSHISPTKGERPGTGDFESKTYPDPRLDLTANNVSIIGEGMNNTSVKNICPDVTVGANPIEGLRNAYTLHNTGTGTYIQDIKLINGMADNTGRGEAYEESGDKTILKNVGLWGYQDTYCSNNGRGRYYFEGGVVRGRTDYICGKDDIFFNGVEFLNVGTGGYIAVPSSPKQYGWILRDCRITAENASETNGKYNLGRPWGSGTPIALWINTTCEVIPSAAGWAEMSGGYPKRFAEYNSMTKDGTPIDLKSRKTTFGDGHQNNPILTAEEAAFYTVSNVLGGDDDWDPTALTEQASAPSKVTINNLGILKWEDSNYVLLWAVCCNGKVVDFTIEPTYNTNGIKGQWSVRAANEMGGLSEAAVAGNVDVDIIMGNQAEVVSSVYFNVAGARVGADYEGVVIRIDTLADGTTVTSKYVNK